MDRYVNELLDFISECPSPYHAVEHIQRILNHFDFKELKETTKWKIEAGKSYYVIRDNASIIAFKVGNEFGPSFHITASHLDSPTYKLKPNCDMVQGDYKKLNVEGYGGMIESTWFDRPLGVAGRVMVKTPNGVEERLVNLLGHNVIIPNLAIHLNRPEAIKTNPQLDILPIVGLANNKKNLLDQIKHIVICSDDEELLSHDLFLYNKEKGCMLGLNNELLASPKLDDLECVFTTLEAFLEAKPKDFINVCSIFDNEEVGSGSNHAAGSTFLTDTLERICSSLKLDKYQTYASSMLLSCDNAHAVHPAHPEKSDPTNGVFMNKGIVIKSNAALKYTTEAIGSAIFKSILKDKDIPYQDYTNNNAVGGGSTLGHIQLEKLSITSIDIGLAQLAMHSSYETAGCKDLDYMVKGVRTFYETNIIFDNKEIIIKGE